MRSTISSCGAILGGCSSSPWTYSPLVLPYGATNRLKVERKGAEITVYVNNELVQTIVDGPYSGELSAGLYAGADSLSAATVRFDNFRIEAP